jgi:hypothetical protein
VFERCTCSGSEPLRPLPLAARCPSHNPYFLSRQLLTNPRLVSGLFRPVRTMEPFDQNHEPP